MNPCLAPKQETDTNQTPPLVRPFVQKNIFQLASLLRRSIRAVREWNKPRFEAETEGAAGRHARRTIRAQAAVPVINAAVAEINHRLASPLRCALPKKQQRKLGIIPAI